MSSQTPHYATVELAGVVLKLRDGLTFALRQHGGQHVYVVEDEVNSKYYRIGVPEYTFISLLDGYATVGEALGRAAAVLGEQALTEHEVGGICKWLIDSQLAFTDESRSSGRLLDAATVNRSQKTMQRFNPVTPKFPLTDPDSFLSALNRVFGWVFSVPMAVVWITVCGFGIFSVSASWDGFTTSVPRVISQDNWLWLLATWVILKIVHETAHGMACKRFGGTVREVGILFILLIPLPYVDVTSAWRFPSKWARVFTSAAGMYAELFIAAVAAVVWSFADSSLVRQHAMNAMVSASAITLLFNANPLMRFDGYFILTDWLEVPNLASHAAQFMKQVGRRVFLGLPSKFNRWPEGKSWLIAFYGPLALLWRIVICVGIFLTAERLFHGAGLAIGFLAIAMWIIVPVLRLAHFVLFGTETEKPNRRRFAFVTSCVLLASFLLLAYVPWYGRISAPAIVDYHPMVQVHSGVSGFVSEVKVQDGDHVDVGDVLVVLENKDLTAELRTIQAQINATEVRAREYRSLQEIPAYQIEMRNLAALEERLAQKRIEFEKLTIRAPEAGTAISDDLDALLGLHVSRGHHVLSIGPTDSVQIHAMVAQSETQEFLKHAGKNVRVRVWGHGKTIGTIERMIPRATTQLPHAAFGAAAGGPIDIVQSAVATEQRQQDDTSASPQNTENQSVASEPHLVANIRLSSGRTAKLRPGCMGEVSFRTNRGSIGSLLVQRIHDWITTRRESAG